MNRRWSDKEREYIKLNAGILTDKQMAAQLCRITKRHITLQSVRKQRQKMGIKKKHGRGVCGIQVNSNGDAHFGLCIVGREDS